MRAPLVAAALLAAACVPGEGPLMDPGQDCLSCHGGGGEGNRWTAAGTWAKGAQVTLTDANGRSFTLRGNDVGNFYTAESLAFPLHVSVDGKPMEDPVVYGGCNLCHQGPGPAIDLELMAPGRDCLVCHDGGMATRFYAAGTFPPGGRPVVVGDRTATTNAVGNFYIVDPISPAFPAEVPTSVSGEWMDDPPPTYGGCNACHGDGEPDDD